MASGPNNIIIRLTDQVDPQIEVKIAGIGAASRTTANGLAGLQAALGKLNTGGLSGLTQTLRSISTSTNTLTKATTSMGNAAIQASGQVDKLSTSYANLALRMSVALSTLQAFTAAAANANGGVLTFKNNLTGAGQAATQGGISTFQVSSAIKTIEGNATGAGLALARLISQSSLLSAALKVAFPIIGVVAFIEILGKVVDEIDNARRHYLAFQEDTAKQSLLEVNLGVKKTEGEKGFTSTLSNALYGRQNAGNVITQDPAELERQISLQDRLAAVQASQLTVGKQGVALQKAKVQGIQDEIDLVGKQISQVTASRNVLQNPETGQGILSRTTEAIAAPLNFQNNSLINQFRGLQGLQDNISKTTKQAAIPTDSPQWKTLTSDLKSYNDEIQNLQIRLKELQAKKTAQEVDPLYGIHDSIKAAREQLKQFQEQLDQLKTYGRTNIPLIDIKRGLVQPTTTPVPLQDQLALLQKQRDVAVPENVVKVDTEIANITQRINLENENRARDYDLLLQKYQDQISQIGLYNDALREESLYDKALIQLKKDKVSVTADELSKLRESINQVVESGEYQKQLNKIYEEAVEPVQKYGDTIRAALKLFSDGAISQKQYTDSIREATLHLNEALDPLTQYKQHLQDEVDLLGIYGQKLRVSQELQQASNILRQKGQVLTDSQAASLRSQLTVLDNERIVQTDVNVLYNHNIEAIHNTTLAMIALNEAREKGIISDNQFRQGIRDTATELAKLQIAMGKGTAKDNFVAIFGDALKGTGTAMEELDNIGTKLLVNLQGIGTAFAKAAFGQESLGAAMRQFGQQIVGELIADLTRLAVKLLEEYILATLLKTALGGILGGSGGNFTGGAGAGVGSAPTGLGIGSSVAAPGYSSGGWVMPHYSDGGPVSQYQPRNKEHFTSPPVPVPKFHHHALHRALGGPVLHAASGLLAGPGGPYTDSIPAFLSAGEYIVNAADTARNLPDLERINHGGKAVGSGSTQKIEVIHDGSTAISVQPVSEGKVKIIAQQIAIAAVHEHAPIAIAADIQNANSRTSKAIARNIDAPRKRGS